MGLTWEDINMLYVAQEFFSPILSSPNAITHTKKETVRSQKKRRSTRRACKARRNLITSGLIVENESALTKVQRFGAISKI